MYVCYAWVFLHAERAYDAKPNGRQWMVGSEQADWKGGQEEGLLMDLEGEEEERQGGVYLGGEGRGGEGDETRGASKQYAYIT